MKEWIQSLVGDGAGFKFTCAVSGAILSIYGHWTEAMTILGLLMIADYITGWTVACVEKKLSSRIGARGILKKVGISLVVALGHGLDVVLGTDEMFRDGAVFFYIANEALSITENLVQIGVPIPDPIKRALQIIQERSDKE